MKPKTYSVIKKDLTYEMDYFSYMGRNIFIFPFIGKSKLVLFCFGLINFLLAVTTTQLLITVCLIGFSDFFGILNVAPNLGVVLMAILKFSKIHLNRNLYDKIFRHFYNDFFDIVSDNDAHLSIVQMYTAFIRFVTRFVYYYCVPLIIVVNSFPRVIMYYNSEILGKTLQYLYPFDGWYPFDKVVWYNTAYIWESLMTFVVICIYGFCNMVHAAYTALICMELKILGSSLENLITAADVSIITKYRNDFVTRSKIKKNLSTIITRHQFMAEISAELGEALGDGMLLTYMFGSVFICLTMFTATAVDDFYKSLRYFFMCCSLLVEVFVQCIIGQVIDNHSADLSTTIYSADWTNADKDTKTMLIVLMVRTQRPFRFSANGYINMNLVSFCRVCSFSYNLFNLLHTTFHK